MSPELSILWIPALCLAGFFVSLRLEKICRPACAGVRRAWWALAVHCGLLLSIWALAFAVFQRPVFAMLAVLAGQFVVVQVNNAKFRALREPFLFSDFGIFSQAVKHPRLYFPFLGIWRAAAIALVGGAAVGVGWWLEPPVQDFLIWSGAVAAAGLLALAVGLAFGPAPALDPSADLRRSGLFSSIAQYSLREISRQPIRETSLPSIGRRGDGLPDIVVIQSESFFDPRRTFAGIRRDVLKNFDDACAAAALHGRLQVPAWGANTMRPEFSFLSGIPPESLDVHRFNPYRRVAREPMRALPAVLREAGYATSCIHPHPARFFRRDRAFPHLGFERFIDGRHFRGAKEAGPYVSDESVVKRLLAELRLADGPSFFFVITMENHGPLHLEQFQRAEEEEYFHEPPADGCGDLGVYLRHLRNADRELGRLRESLRARRRPCILCFYGEHVPSMPKVYDSLGVPDGTTDYFLEMGEGSGVRKVDLPVERLPFEILGQVQRFL
jgi:phosphoglycerol transferase MdoB-like AlkP superfamily enzyme